MQPRARRASPQLDGGGRAAAPDPHRSVLKECGPQTRPPEEEAMADRSARLDRNLALEAVRVTEAAALAASQLMGRGDEKAADQAAVDAMRTALNSAGHRRHGRDRRGRARRGADALYRREGRRRQGPKIDIALDPLEGTTITAKGRPNALAVIAMARGRRLPQRARRLHGQDRGRRRPARRRRRSRQARRARTSTRSRQGQGRRRLATSSPASSTGRATPS